MALTEAERLNRVLKTFHALFSEEFRIVAKGGFAEPFYQAPRPPLPGEIRFRGDYLNSCLHEMAHWLIAGAEKRKCDDFGYWYAPDGRDSRQQAEFFAAEVKPQAMESLLARACGIDFRLSVDNLDGGSGHPGDLERFAKAVEAQCRLWRETVYPRRAALLLAALSEVFA